MLEYLEKILGLIKVKSRDEIAEYSAYLLVPFIILGWTLWGFLGGEAITLERPFTISELKTEIDADNNATPKKGVVVVAEPGSSEYQYRIPLTAGTSKVWSSLDEHDAEGNTDRFVFDGGGMKGKTPFIGVNVPVTIVIEGEIGKNIEILGDKEPAENWQAASRRSNALISTVLAACFFAFGVSAAQTIRAPSAGGDQDSASKIRTEPDKD
jgi:hypothetical protein